MFQSMLIKTILKFGNARHECIPRLVESMQHCLGGFWLNYHFDIHTNQVLHIKWDEVQMTFVLPLAKLHCSPPVLVLIELQVPWILRQCWRTRESIDPDI